MSTCFFPDVYRTFRVQRDFKMLFLFFKKIAVSLFSFRRAFQNSNQTRFPYSLLIDTIFRRHCCWPRRTPHQSRPLTVQICGPLGPVTDQSVMSFWQSPHPDFPAVFQGDRLEKFQHCPRLSCHTSWWSGDHNENLIVVSKKNLRYWEDRDRA